MSSVIWGGEKVHTKKTTSAPSSWGGAVAVVVDSTTTSLRPRVGERAVRADPLPSSARRRKGEGEVLPPVRGGGAGIARYAQLAFMVRATSFHVGEFILLSLSGRCFV